MKRAIIVALLVAGCSDASYPRLESAPNTYTASQVWLAERFGPVTYCWSENASAPRTCTYTPGAVPRGFAGTRARPLPTRRMVAMTFG
jgi:hypothetical protein